MLEFRLPSLGADMDEGTLLEWLVGPGDSIEVGTIVAVVDTTKAAIDVESWVEGTVHRLVVGPGETVPVGTVLALVLEPGEAAPPEEAEPAPAVAAAPPPAPTAAPPPTAIPAPPVAQPTGTRRRISPAARRRAAELGLDPQSIPAGPDDTVSLADVERAAATAARPQPEAPPDRAAQMRRTIAAAMARSKREIPHYYLTETVPLARASVWLAAWNAEHPITERLVMAALQLKAVALAAARVPEVNGHYEQDRFTPADVVDVGVAISLRTGGLVVPALHDVAGMALPDLMAAMVDLVARARAGSLRSSEVSGATITVTNLGDRGVEAVFPIIHPPQVAIVGFGTIAPRPWVVDGELAVVPTVVASLAADHRVSDGHRGGLFLAGIRDRLQHPEDL